jgi:DNA-binding transcriptional LysR family regulator
MRLEHLEAFVEVGRRGSVSRAAEALFVTQPTLTARLKGLERELDAKLFVRSQRGMRLSDSGRAFLPYAERTLDTVATGRRLLSELARGEGGQLALGAAPAVSTYVLPRILRRFRATHPKVALAVRTGHSEEVLELVLREQVQVGLGRALNHPDVQAIPFYEDELVLVADPKHPFARQAAISPDQLTEAQLILFDRTSSYHRLTFEFFQQLGALPRGVMELDNIDAAKKMVEQGLGVAFLPHTAVAGELEGGSLTPVTIADVSFPRRRIVIFRRRDAGSASGVLEAFLNCLSDLRPALQAAAQRATA